MTHINGGFCTLILFLFFFLVNESYLNAIFVVKRIKILCPVSKKELGMYAVEQGQSKQALVRPFLLSLFPLFELRTSRDKLHEMEQSFLIQISSVMS